MGLLEIGGLLLFLMLLMLLLWSAEWLWRKWLGHA